MSCDKRCTNVNMDEWLGHHSCAICPGRDDGRPSENYQVVNMTKKELQSHQEGCPCLACKNKSFDYVVQPG